MAVKIILRKTVENLGKPGDVVRVKPGYAHNYLIPQQFALAYSDGNVRRIENEKRVLAVREAKIKADAETLAKQFKGTKLEFVKKCGIEGVLYGSVTPAEVAEAITAKGLDTDKKHVLLSDAIKRIGEFNAKLRLHPEVELVLEITVRSEDGLAEAHLAEKAAEVAVKTTETVEAVAEEVKVEEVVEEAVVTKEETTEDAE